MTICQHCGASGVPLIQLAGAVRVCHACWQRQHNAGVTTCSQCRKRIDPWAQPGTFQAQQRIVCETCYWKQNTASGSTTTSIPNAQPQWTLTLCDCEWDEVRSHSGGVVERFKTYECDRCIEAEMRREPSQEEVDAAIESIKSVSIKSAGKSAGRKKS